MTVGGHGYLAGEAFVLFPALFQRDTWVDRRQREYPVVTGTDLAKPEASVLVGLRALGLVETRRIGQQADYCAGYGGATGSLHHAAELAAIERDERSEERRVGKEG